MADQDDQNRRRRVKSKSKSKPVLPSDDETESNAEAESPSGPNLEGSVNLSENTDSALESGGSLDKISKVLSKDTINSENSEFTSSGFETDRTNRPEGKGRGKKGSKKVQPKKASKIVQPKSSKSMLELPTSSKGLDSRKSKIDLSRSLSDVKDSNSKTDLKKIDQSESSSISTCADHDSKTGESSSYTKSKCKPDLNRILLPEHPVEPRGRILTRSASARNAQIPRNRPVDSMELADILDNFHIDDAQIVAGGNAGRNPGGDAGGNPSDNSEDSDISEDQNPQDMVKPGLTEPSNEDVESQDQSSSDCESDSSDSVASFFSDRFCLNFFATSSLIIFLSILFIIIKGLERLLRVTILNPHEPEDEDYRRHFGLMSYMDAPEQD